MDATVSTYVDGNTLATALLSGIHQVISEQDHLNRINVFPVADGDTGTNLSLSLGSALHVLQQPDDKHLGMLLAAFADALLDGARGNSGSILAQFFQGLSDAAGELSRFTTYTFGKAVRQGSDYAHDAMSNPSPGTILSVISAFAQSIHHESVEERSDDFPTVLKAALEHSQLALARTEQELDVLRKAGVIDAGARGFVALLEGFTRFVSTGEVTTEPDLSAMPADAAGITLGPDEDSEYRYCTECIVTGDDIDRRKLRELLSTLGDSLVLAGTQRKAKIHIHVNDPEQVFDTGRQFGNVTAEKADDMRKQTHSSHDRVSTFAVITDSAADIADKDMERLDIHIVPCRLQFGNRGFLDKVSIDADEFFEELKVNPNHPTTSQPSPGDFRRQFQFLASHFRDVVSINVSGAASGTLEAAQSAAERSNAPGRIHVIDSLNASLGQGLLVVFAAECAHAGIGVDRAVAAIRALIPETRTYGVLETMKYAVRGGRLPGWVQTVAKIFNITPFIRTTEDGRIAPSGFCFGRRHRARKFARQVVRRARNAGPLAVAIGHASCPRDARVLENILREELPDIRRLTRAGLSAVLGAHTGPGTLVVAIQPFRTPGDVLD